MLFFIVGGFSVEGKIKLIQHMMRSAIGLKDGCILSVVLNELGEGELNAHEIDSDTIHVYELRGGCPCCTLQNELLRILEGDALKCSDAIVMEVSGLCDMEQLKHRLIERNSSWEVTSVVVIDAGSLKPLFEVVPVISRNLAVCDAVSLVKGAGDGELELSTAQQILNGIIETQFYKQTTVAEGTILTRTKTAFSLLSEQ
jgi:G3E family GTPase